MQIHQTSQFREEFSKLTKPKYKTTYGSLKANIDSLFKGSTFEEIWSLNYPLVDYGTVRINKVRMANEAQNHGTSGGFRLIVFCERSDQSVTMLYVFPKVGPHKISNLNDKFTKSLIESFAKQKKAGELVEWEL